ncbi:hypothetical protein HYH03_017931 [Edaphochlamys debaryana]|uniref:Protein kinase domain-containing protein n=1 Tax=Edaphochlamys debaryana TaxID=47281 RepID=A0A835XGA8_9CHLO|nr:hypothetical protein HYH03_017931 [Edaphochlamys debaryana]|eukprot:KAG2483196.1 hypothetical protein HYH03_017931 [Edaphochlamys debaryana]
MGLRGTVSAGPTFRTWAGRALPQAGPLPPCWAQVLDCIHGAVPGSDLGAAVLVPLVFGARRIGAMLLVLPPGGQGQAPLSLSGPGALEALGACVAECCLGPVLPAVEQVAVASSAVASAASLSELATALTSSLSSALSAELHVDLTVRLAVLPHKEAGSGVLFSTAADGTASRSGMHQPPSPNVCASPLGTISKHGAIQTAPTRPVQSFRALNVCPPSPSTLMSQSPSQAIPRGSILLPGPRSGTVPFATGVSGPVPVLDDEATEVSLAANVAGSRRGTQVGVLHGSHVTAGAPPAVNMGGGMVTSISLEPILANRQAAALRHLASGNLAAGSLTAPPRMAWKACPFTSSSTLLAALLAGKAGAEVGPSPLLLPPSQSSGTTLNSNSASQVVSASVRAAPPVSSGLLALRSHMVPDVPAFLHDFERPSKDVFSIVRRAGGAGGLASLVAISAAWAAPAAPLLLSTAAAEGGSTSPGPAEVARLPALGVYIYSALPLPQSLLLAARDHAAGLLKVLAPGVIRVLSCGPVADQWAVLAGQAMGGGLHTAPVSTSRALGIASGGGAGSAAAGSGGAQALHAFIVDAGVDVYQPLMPLSPTSNAAPGTELQRTTSRPARLLSTNSPHIIVPDDIIIAAAGSGAGGMGPSVNTSMGESAVPARHLMSSSILDVGASKSCNSSGGRTGPGPGLGIRMHPSAKSLILPGGSRSGTVSAASAHHLAISRSINLDAAIAEEARRPPRRLSTFAPGSRVALDSNDGRRATTYEVSRTEFSQSGAILATDPGQGYADGHGSVGHDALVMLTETTDLGAAAQQHQMATLVTAFTTTLARTRTETDVHGSVHAEDDIRALTISRPIGQGACSVVMLGRLHAMPVAVKVILPADDDETGDGAEKTDKGPERQSQALPSSSVAAEESNARSGATAGEATPVTQLAQARASAVRGTTLRRRKRLQALMRGARELAVLTSISHPNIVQVYSHCTRVVVEEPEPFRPRLRVVPEGAESEAPVCTALIMEYCDMGSLADAIDSGMFVKAARRAAASNPANQKTQRHPLASAAAAGTPAMRAVYLTLLEVALALRHLHSMNLVHCDVKPANVLLRSSATDPRGFTAKLTDFGFVNLIPNPTERQGSAPEAASQEPVGTVTHMAPELFVNGAHVDSSIDCYAFGILMWETYTGRAPYPAYADTNFAEVPDKVSKEGLRPPFPPETPLNFKQLAQECWSAAPSQRPSAASLVVRLQALLDASCGV